jgi:SWI/SNF-related matrix-associated actin-dependent regulator of chromatin subfamily A member 5
MAASRNLPDSDASSQVDTPMTDGNESVTRIPVDEPDYPMAVRSLSAPSVPFIPPGIF